MLGVDFRGTHCSTCSWLDPELLGCGYGSLNVNEMRFKVYKAKSFTGIGMAIGLVACSAEHGSSDSTWESHDLNQFATTETAEELTSRESFDELEGDQSASTSVLTEKQSQRRMCYSSRKDNVIEVPGGDIVFAKRYADGHENSTNCSSLNVSESHYGPGKNIPETGAYPGVDRTICENFTHAVINRFGNVCEEFDTCSDTSECLWYSYDSLQKMMKDDQKAVRLVRSQRGTFAPSNGLIDSKNGEGSQNQQVHIWNRQDTNVNQFWIEHKVDTAGNFDVVMYREWDSRYCLDGGAVSDTTYRVLKLYECDKDNENQQWVKEPALGGGGFTLEKRNERHLAINGGWTRGSDATVENNYGYRSTFFIEDIDDDVAYPEDYVTSSD